MALLGHHTYNGVSSFFLALLMSYKQFSFQFHIPYGAVCDDYRDNSMHLNTTNVLNSVSSCREVCVVLGIAVPFVFTRPHVLSFSLTPETSRMSNFVQYFIPTQVNLYGLGVRIV